MTTVQFKGLVEPIANQRQFYMVVVDDSTPPTWKHDNYDDAFNEAMRLSKKLNKDAYVVVSLARIQQVPYVTALYAGEPPIGKTKR